MVVFAWVVSGVIFLAALSLMVHCEAKSTRRDEKMVDRMFVGKKR